jgi:hypothetical protein
VIALLGLHAETLKLKDIIKERWIGALLAGTAGTGTGSNRAFLFLKGHGLKREVPGKKNNGFSYEKR